MASPPLTPSQQASLSQLDQQLAALLSKQSSLRAQLAAVAPQLAAAQLARAALLHAAAWTPALSAAMFARISSSRAPGTAVAAFCGGAGAHSVLSAPSVQHALLGCLSTRTVLPLRAVCHEARAAIAGLSGQAKIDAQKQYDDYVKGGGFKRDLPYVAAEPSVQAIVRVPATAEHPIELARAATIGGSWARRWRWPAAASARPFPTLP